jgi:transcriptional regulator with XRE-family HTH domain
MAYGQPVTAPTPAQLERARKLGEQLTKARAGREMSYRDLQEATGISLAHLQRLERGGVAQPSPTLLHKLAGALDLEYISLMKTIGYVT